MRDPAYQNRPCCAASENGFTLVEALFAVLLLSFGLLGYLTLFSNLTRHTINDEFALAATHLASEKIEQLIAEKANSGYISVSTGTTNENITYASQEFTRQTQIEWVAGSDLQTSAASDQGYKHIAVTVSWNVGTAQQVRLSSVIADY